MLSVVEHIDRDGVCTITLDNIGSNPRVIQSIIKQFAVGEELFLGHYRLDGFHLTSSEMQKYGLKIHKFFAQYGDYQFLEKGYLKKNRNYLMACRCPNNEKFYGILKEVLDYYLQTIIFCPLIDWNAFISLHQNYLSFPAKAYIKNKYTNFLFFYGDNGDFSVVFDTHKYSLDFVRRQIDSFLP